jgi:hypothetical protein
VDDVFMKAEVWQWTCLHILRLFVKMIVWDLHKSNFFNLLI